MARPVTQQPLATTTVDDSVSTSIAVCELVSNVSDTPVRELPPLGQAIDSDCLDDLFSRRASTGRLTFQFAGYDVVAQSENTVELYGMNTVTN